LNFIGFNLLNLGTTSGCAVHHTASMPSLCSEQPELIPDPLRWHINKCLCNKRKGGMDLGSELVKGAWTFLGYI